MARASGNSARRIVVGVDGSPSSVEALRWAIGEAEVTGGRVKAVIAWEYPLAGGELGWQPMITDKLETIRASADKALARAIDKARPPGCEISIEGLVVEGSAPAVLVRESDQADLLVVGSRGHGTFTDALLGSVCQNCAHHARCPIVIIRGQAGA